MNPVLRSNRRLAAAITHAASKQTYYTVRFLVDPQRIRDAYRAYAYFRWVDDWLDRQTGDRTQRLAFVRRQQALMESLYCRETPGTLCAEEQFLADLVAGDREKNSGLQAYIHNMMAVMVFDAERRGRLISQAELNEYTHWLAVSVTEALHYFIGHDSASPHNRFRYLAATGAHIAHMLRDAVEDAQAGYYNIPQEVVAAHGIAPWDVASPAYRDWVKSRVQEARACFAAGKSYLVRVESLRCRMAGYAYMLRFEGILDAIEREGYLLRTGYTERKHASQALQMFLTACWMAVNCHPVGAISSAVSAR
ncbi:MAG: phytoene/squalene synthase family protein [Chloroflexota bacterium]